MASSIEPAVSSRYNQLSPSGIELSSIHADPRANALRGIRRGECAGIKLSAVDLRGKTITICSCVMYDPKNGVYEKPYL